MVVPNRTRPMLDDRYKTLLTVMLCKCFVVVVVVIVVVVVVITLW